MYALGMTSSPSSEPALRPVSRLDALAAEIAREAETASMQLEAEALAAFRAGDGARILALVDERTRLGDLAASLARWSGGIKAAPTSSVALVAPPTPAPPSAPALPIAPAPATSRFAARESGSPPTEIPAPREEPKVAPVVLSEPVAIAAPKPALKAEPEPKPERVRAPRPPKPIPEGPLEGRALTATRARFFDDSRVLLAHPGAGGGPVALRAARLKSAICLGRALEGAVGDPDHKRLVGDELRSLRDAWNAAVPHDFFGLNPGRYVEAEGWYRLSRAFALTAEAEEALPTVADEGAAGSNRDVAADAIAAAVGLAQGTMNHYAEGAGDAEMNDLRAAVEALGRLPRLKEIQIAIRRKPADWSRYEEMASGLPAMTKRLKTEGERRARQEDALADFERELKEGAADEGFVDRLVATAKSALAAGVRPNAPRLRDPMMAYGEILREPDAASDPALKPLFVEMAKQANLLAARKAVVEETDLHADDPEHETRLAAVRAYLAGKSLGFAGSRRGIDRKVQEFGRALGAREVVWPDVEKQHAVGPLVEAVKDCDVVCLIVRFCRHSYKDALDKAKKGGARLVFLPRGLGLNTVVYELYTQLQLESLPMGNAEAA